MNAVTLQTTVTLMQSVQTLMVVSPANVMVAILEMEQYAQVL